MNWKPPSATGDLRGKLVSVVHLQPESVCKDGKSDVPEISIVRLM